MDDGFQILIFLFLGMISGFLDAIGSSGGIFSVPVLLSLGVNPINALACNKAQGLFGTLSSIIVFINQRKLKLKDILNPIAIICSSFGTIFLFFIGNGYIKIIIPILLLFIAIYYLFSKEKDIKTRKVTFSKSLYAYTFLPIISFYDGFFGPGTSMFFTASINKYVGSDIRNSIMQARAFNLSSNFGSLLIFLFTDTILWGIVISMIVGQVIGGYLGAKITLVVTQNILKLFLIVTCVVLSIRLLV